MQERLLSLVETVKYICHMILVHHQSEVEVQTMHTGSEFINLDNAYFSMFLTNKESVKGTGYHRFSLYVCPPRLPAKPNLKPSPPHPSGPQTNFGMSCKEREMSHKVWRGGERSRAQRLVKVASGKC